MMRWFEIALVVLTLFTGLVWLLDKLVFAKRRAAKAKQPTSRSRKLRKMRSVIPHTTWRPTTKAGTRQVRPRAVTSDSVR